MHAAATTFKSWVRRQSGALLIKCVSDPGKQFGFAYSCAERGPLSSTILLAMNVEAPYDSIATSAVGHIMNYVHYRAAQGHAIAEGQVWSSDDCECPPQPQFNFMLIQATKAQVSLLIDERARIVMWRSDVFLANARIGSDANRILVLVPMKQGETAEDYDQLRAVADDMIQTSLSARNEGLFGTAGGGGLERRVVSPPKYANSGCARISAHMTSCDQCHQTRYCSSECRAKHWSVHKLACMKCAGCGVGGNGNCMGV